MKVFYFPVITALAGVMTSRISILTAALKDGQPGKGLYVAIWAAGLKEAEWVVKNPEARPAWIFVHDPVGGREQILCGKCRGKRATWILHTLDDAYPFCDVDAWDQHEFQQEEGDDFLWEDLITTEGAQAA